MQPFIYILKKSMHIHPFFFASLRLRWIIKWWNVSFSSCFEK